MIVEETLRPGAMEADVARGWQVSAGQMFTWRRAMRGGAAAPLDFVPIVRAPAPQSAGATSAVNAKPRPIHARGIA